jgi:DNA-binding transcriptional ArsR family regulator
LRGDYRQNILSVMTHPSSILPGPSALPDVAIIDDVEAAAVLLKDPRRSILEMARSPITTVEVAHRLGEPRQRVGHHVRRLAEAGLLREVDSSRRGAMVERRYRASAARYALAPELLGPLAARLESRGDRASLAHLLGAVHEVQTDLVGVLSTRQDPGVRVPTLTLSSRLRFRNAAQRGAFADALVRALSEVVAAHASPFDSDEDAPAGGDPFRLTLTLHPTPP